VAPNAPAFWRAFRIKYSLIEDTCVAYTCLGEAGSLRYHLDSDVALARLVAGIAEYTLGLRLKKSGKQLSLPAGSFLLMLYTLLI
jgi:hypothetical protein